jgi:peptidoglycan glycosyltransferase
VNNQIRHLFLLVALLFTLLVAYTSRWTVFEAEALKDNAHNRRALLEEMRIPRGVMTATDGTVLASSKREGTGQLKSYVRQYPEGPLFSHAIGYSFITRGSAGMERALDDELAGRDDEFATLIDEIMGRKKEGRDVRTTLDPDGQRAALAALQGRKGAVVAIEPATGRVRVMASVPGYDPNQIPGRGSKAGDLFNRATAGRYPAGSTMKVVTAAAALDSGRFKPDTVVSGKSPKVIDGVPLNNFGGQDYGPVTLTDALTHSVNTVWAEVGVKLGRKTMYDYLQRFGFQRKLSMEYPKDEMSTAGLFQRGRVAKDANDVDIGRVAIGQEQHLFVTPLQMATVAATVANGGNRMRLRLVERVVAKDGRVTRRVRPKREQQAISLEAANQLKAMMSRVVEEGTGTAARLQGVSVAGKTGTAEIPGRTENQVWFIGFAPVENPRMAVAVTIERTQGEGGTVAAPVAKQVLQALLGGGAGG